MQVGLENGAIRDRCCHCCRRKSRQELTREKAQQFDRCRLFCLFETKK